jgi:hypothetical protein
MQWSKGISPNKWEYLITYQWLWSMNREAHNFLVCVSEHSLRVFLRDSRLILGLLVVLASRPSMDIEEDWEPEFGETHNADQAA